MFVVDPAQMTQEELERGRKEKQLLWQFNQLSPDDPAKGKLLNELFKDVGEHSRVAAPLQGVCFHKVALGKDVYVNSNCLMMARGGIHMEDKVMIAANVQLITNNHDFYRRELLICSPIYIKEGAWIGAGATILPGVTIGRYAVVGAASVVSKDVDDYAIVVGNPARKVKELDPEGFR